MRLVENDIRGGITMSSDELARRVGTLSFLLELAKEIVSLVSG